MKIRNFLLTVILLCSQLSWAGFDPMNQDIDLFLTNPALSSTRPNVLIVLDNTANWNTAFTDEKSALVSLVNSLTDEFNVGLMMYVETGSGNDNIDGGYVRFGVRQMKNTDSAPTSSGTSSAPNNRWALATMVNALDKLGDKGNNNTISLDMPEVYNYFKGTTSRSSYGKAKTDFANNTANDPYAASIGNNALPSAPTSTSLFNSPVTDGCQKNFIIYIGNGKFNENASATATSLSLLTSANGGAPTTIPISPSGQQGNWADEWSYFLAHKGLPMTIGGGAKTVFVNTYTVAIDPTSKSWDSDSLALMQSMATQGLGQYYTAVSGDGGASIADALNNIFTEIQSVNSVFASATLPLSVNVRGTNLNQVYIGMFRPDGQKAPRWYGNLKLYTFSLDSTGNLFLADANNAPAEDASTGFISSIRTSYWTHASTFWSWRTSSDNGVGGSSDAPDGNLVEKGAVAQRLREAFATAQTTRNLYTCTSNCLPCTISGSGSAQTCTGGSLLSATPFDTTNADITPTALGLSTKAVSPLTAKRSVTVSSIADRRSVTLSNVSSGTVTTISSLNDGAITKAVSSISTGVTMSITTLSALATATATISSYSTTSGSSKVTTVTTSTAHGLSVGTSITISGASNQLNGTYSVATVPTTTTFTISAGSAGSGTTGTVSYSKTSTTATATVSNHGLTSGQTVTISGASPSTFNGSFGVTVTGTNTFTYLLPTAQGAATVAGSMTKTTTTATITTSTAHGFSAGNSVTIAGASPSGYNGTYTILASPAPTSTTFAVTTSALSDNTATGVTVTKGATTTATATTSSAHGYTAGVTQVTIAGADSCYNGTYTVATTPTSSSFTYPLASACTQNTASSGMTATSNASYGTTVTGTLANHGYSVGSAITIADGTIAAHNGSFTVASVPSTSTFTYTNSNVSGVAPGTGYTVQLTSNPLAYVSATTHGFSTGDSVTITGSTTASDTPATSSNAYNGTFTVTSIDANTFSYPLSAAKGTQTATSAITASVNTTTATATSVNHGFATGTTVVISGATPAAFNGSFVITSTGTNSFQYTLPSAQGDATGTIQAAAGSGSNSEQTLLINWVRGQDNNTDENSDGSKTDCRASVHGDVLHSRPAVVNYNRYGGNNDVYVFYGANDGVFRAIKGGTTNDKSDPTTLSPGMEAWGFVPTEGFTNLTRLRNNSPVIGSNFKKPYFMDGPIGILTIDGNSDGQESSSTPSDKVYLYVGARRGGRFIYSFDVTNPTVPAYRWKIDNTSTGFKELGYTWSQPNVVSGINGYTNPVLIFGGGYDPSAEDIENCTITSTTAASYNSGTYTPGSITYNNGTVTYSTTGTGCTVSNGTSTSVSRSMGRAIYVVDAITGQKIWSASYPGSGADLEVPGMDYAISSDITIVKNLSGGSINRGYVGDSGGNLWRIDFADSNKSNWTVTKIASISDLTTSAGRRKFQNPPDVVSETGFDAIVIGTGDREHPFDTTVVNRFYMFREHGSATGPGTGTTYANSGTTTRTAASDGSGNPVINHSNTVDGQLVDVTTSYDATAAAASDGWFFTLGTGEKQIGGAVALGGFIYFNTNQPSQTEDSSCVGNLGIARKYQVGVADGLPVGYKAGDTVTLAARSTIAQGGGFLPAPVHGIVQLVDANGNEHTVEYKCEGAQCEQIQQTSVGTRTRRFWYKEIDQ